MAELDPIERKLILTIEEHLAGALKAAGELRSVGDAAKKASTGLEKYGDAVADAAKSGNKAAKAWMHMVGSAKLATTATRRAAAAFVASTGVLSKLWDSLVKNNQAFMDLALSSMNTSNVVQRLESTVDSVRGSFDLAAVSYRDAAEALAAFKSQSIGLSTALESIPDFEKKFIGVFETLSQLAGQDTAQALLNELQGFGLASFQIEDALSTLVKGTKESRAEFVAFISNIDSTNDAMGRWALQTANTFEGMKETRTRSITDWKAFWSRLTTMFEDFGTKLFDTVGLKLKPLFANLESHYPAIITKVGDAIDWVSSHSEDIVAAFNKVVNTISGAIGWFDKLGSTMKVIVGLGAGSLLLPGFAPALLTVAGGAISLSKHLLGLSGILLGPITSSFASIIMALPGATTAMNTFGVTSKFVTGVLGPFAIAAGAAYLAFDQFRTWYSKGIEHTWGGKIRDWWFDYEDQIDQINKKHVKYESTWLGFGNKEISQRDDIKSDYDRKKKVPGQLKPDEQTFDEFYKKRMRVLKEIEDGDKGRVAAEKQTQAQIGRAADNAAKDQAARAEEVKKKLRVINNDMAADSQNAAFGAAGASSMDKFTQSLAAARVAADPNEMAQSVATLAISGEKWKTLETGLEGAAKKAEQLTSLIETMGPSPALRQSAAEQAANITSMVPVWQKIADLQVAAAEVQVANAKTSVQRDAAEKRLSNEVAKQAKVADMIRVSTELTTKSGEKAAEVQNLRVQASKTALQIAQATLGAAGLSVKAQMNVVEGLQKEKELLKDAHAAILDKIATEPYSLVTQEKELMLRNKILSITADQVNMLKELRDGYLSAVQAQAFGAGKFEKIIITQEKNLRLGLAKDIVKANVLMGTVGEAARRSNIPMARYSAGGYGLEKLDGGMMNDQDIKDWQEQIGINLVDEATKAATKAATAITFESMGLVDTSLGQVRERIDAFDDAVDKSIASMSRFGAALGGAGKNVYSVIGGQAMRTGQIPAAATPNRGPGRVAGKYPTAYPDQDMEPHVKAALQGGQQRPPSVPAGSGVVDPFAVLADDVASVVGKVQSNLASFVDTYLTPEAAALGKAQSQSAKLTALKEAVANATKVKKSADEKYDKAYSLRSVLSEKVYDRPTPEDKIGALFTFGQEAHRENIRKARAASTAAGFLPGAKEKEAAARAARQSADEKLKKTWHELNKFQREVGYDFQIDKRLSQTQADFDQTLPKAPAEPTIQTVAATSAAESESSRKPRKKGGWGLGSGGGQISQLVRDSYAKLAEVASIVEDYLDEDDETGLTRPSREGSTNVQ